MTAKPLTLRETKLIKGIVEGKTKRQAAMDAFNPSSPEVASTMASTTLKKANVQEALAAAFDRHGITIDKAVAPIAEGLRAEQEYYDKNGESHTRADHSIRLKASGMVFNLMGVGKSGDVNITFIDASQKQREIYDI
jgi:hypothetical protein